MLGGLRGRVDEWWVEGWEKRLLGCWMDDCGYVFGRPFSMVVRIIGYGARCLGLSLDFGISWLRDHGQMAHSLWDFVFLSVKWK